MLDAETKRRIDTARDILVGKVPDPKSQVEQITIALIYKFMDDMDAESEEFGGNRTFFAGDFARYGWAKLMHAGLGGHETLNLYAEAITRMPENPGIPLLFREIFKNAYLPYRDPETLKMFLKVIDEFNYDHSERLGDAFEYLLSVLGSQGDAGQFRTPRHIIDFMVAILDPKKDETVLDPACGTAGFLISSYKHILKANTDEKGRSTLTPDERARLARNFTGYDISPDMVRLSLVNLYLHGFADPHIFEYDTLTSLERWNDYADVILANPPFMTPRGGIRPHKRFSVQSNQSEVLFVDYMAEHLTPNGRAAIIVPEGIIFQTSRAYVRLRQMLVEDYLVAVISLPSGVFNPYSGVKTSILIIDKSLAKKNKHVAFFKAQNDGLSLGAQRREIEKNDLPQIQFEITAYLNHLRNGKTPSELSVEHGLIIEKEKITTTKDFNLNIDRYYEKDIYYGSFELIPISELCELGRGRVISKEDIERNPGEYPVFSSQTQNEGILGYLSTYDFEGEYVTWTTDGANAGTVFYRNGKFNCTNVCGTLKKKSEKIDLRYLARVLGMVAKKHVIKLGNPKLMNNVVSKIEIPLPPLDVQKEIVAEIEGYQKVIDGARAVVENYRPHIPIDPDWPLMEVNKLCEVNPKKTGLVDLDEETVVSFVPMSDINENDMFFIPKATKLLNEVINNYTYFKDGDVLIAKVTPCFENGKAGIALDLINGLGFGSSEFYVLRPSEQVLAEWIYLHIANSSFRNWATPQMTGTGGLQRVPRSVIENYIISMPSIDIQKKLVAEVHEERAIVNANRELITRFAQKIQAVLARVWGEEGKAHYKDANDEN